MARYSPVLKHVGKLCRHIPYGYSRNGYLAFDQVSKLASRLLAFPLQEVGVDFARLVRAVDMYPAYRQEVVDVAAKRGVMFETAQSRHHHFVMTGTQGDLRLWGWSSKLPHELNNADPVDVIQQLHGMRRGSDLFDRHHVDQPIEAIGTMGRKILAGMQKNPTARVMAFSALLIPAVKPEDALVPVVVRPAPSVVRTMMLKLSATVMRRSPQA